MTMLLKDVIEIPEHVGSEDFVLRLTDGVSDEMAEATLDQYVITPEIAKHFAKALGILQSSLGITFGSDGKVQPGPHQPGRAIYLHGSFGSGKSHFMAVLHLLLNGHRDALNRPELSQVVAKHQPWLGTQRFMLVPYHMLGASSLEERVFDGYCRAVQRLHPDAPMPPLFDSDGIVADAENQRRLYGDEAFLKALADDRKDEGWGDLATTWTLESYQEAIAAPHGDPARQRVVAALIERVFPSTGGRQGTIAFDQGLELMTQHAKELGYAGIVLFLDELILWLASRAAAPGFIEGEIDKLVNLVEAQRLDRPIPIVSFIARQRDLRDLIDQDALGIQQLNIDDKLAHHEGRFTTVELSTADLPEIASKRLLKPKGAAARQAIDGAFKAVVSDQVRKVLLGDSADIEQFRKVYPFSPVLVDTLVAASSMLQRDRTALRAMLQLLVERRETLDVGEIIPVGDLYDVISRGTEAITPAFQQAFDRARRLYDQKLVPLLERDHGASRQEILARPWNDELRKKWRADDRILKTLLLASLVSGVPALRHLNAQRVAVLNHGSITTRIPGQEAQVVLTKLRTWGAEVPEIRLSGDSLDPRATLELHGVDVEGILRNADSYDKPGTRVALLKELVFGELGVEEGQLGTRFGFAWRGTKRSSEVVFRNVADLPRASLENDGAEWKVVVDYPMDTNPDGAGRDQKAIDSFRASGSVARTLLWCPAFFNQKARDDLGRLVRLERVLKSDQTFEQHASHLSATDRQQARSLLESQRDTLRDRVKGYLRAAYGLSNEETFTKGLDQALSVEATFVSLDPALSPRPPAAGGLKGGLEGLLEQALDHQFPEAPRWERSFAAAQIRKCLEIAQKAAGSHPPRVALDTAEARLMREFAIPLRLGQCTSAFVLGDYWHTHFNRLLAKTGEKVATVAQVRTWTDEPAASGLPPAVQDLLAIVYAAQGERALYRQGAPLDEVKIGGLQPSDELREIPMPSEDAWKVACERAGAIFGETSHELFRTGANVSSLARRLRNHVRDARPHAIELSQKLREVTPPNDHVNSLRLRDAEAVLLLFDRMDVDDPKALIESLASATIEEPVTPAALGASWRQAEAVVGAIEGTNWCLLEGLSERAGDPGIGPAVSNVLEDLKSALETHQYSTPLQSQLPQIESQATKLLVDIPPPPPPVAKSGSKQISAEKDLTELTQELRRELGKKPGATIDVTWRIRGGGPK